MFKNISGMSVILHNFQSWLKFQINVEVFETPTNTLAYIYSCETICSCNISSFALEDLYFRTLQNSNFLWMIIWICRFWGAPIQITKIIFVCNIFFNLLDVFQPVSLSLIKTRATYPRKETFFSHTSWSRSLSGEKLFFSL